jgi:hypothetical protein
MPTGTARHRGTWLPGQENKTLLIVEGLSGTAQAFDVASGTWRTVGEWVQGSEEGGCGFLPFAVDGNACAWLLNRSEEHYSSKSCMEQKYASLTLLRPPYGSQPSHVPPPEELLITYRFGQIFVPAAGDRPALLIGGSTHAGMNAYLLTGAVEAAGRDGRMWAMPSLRIPRRDAAAFRIGDGVLVVGGTAGSIHDRDADTKALPVEWLASSSPSANVQWTELAGSDLPPSSAYAQLADGSLLAIDRDGRVTQITMHRVPGAAPVLERVPWPSLNRARQSSANERVRVRELADGRVVVAGGQVQAEKIALMKDDVDRPDAADEYVGIGEFLPSRRHEIYDPAVRRWLTSAASVTAGGQVTILADGRVVKLGTEEPVVTAPGAEPALPKRRLEVSTANGMAWGPMPAAGSRLRWSDRYKRFSLDGELFAIGELADVDTGGGPGGVVWFNSATQRWGWS